MLRALLLTLVPLFAVAAEQASPPVAPVRPVTDSYFGEKISDPYRWLEDLKNPEVQTWMRAQAAVTRARLDAVPGREELLSRLQELEAKTPERVGSLHRVNGLIFSQRRAANEEVAKLYVRKGLQGADRLVFDPESLRGDSKTAHTISWYRPSPNGSRVAVATAAAGSELSLLRVFEVDSGKLLDGPMPDLGWLGMNWLDEKRFVVNRTAPEVPGGAANERWLHGQMWLHTIGRPTRDDRAVFGSKVLTKDEIAPEDFPFVDVHSASDFALGLKLGARAELGVFVALVKELGTDRLRWRKMFDFDDSVLAAAARGDSLYVLTTKGAANGQLLQVPLVGKSAPKVLYQGSTAIDLMGVARDAIYFRERDGVYERLMRMDFTGGKPEEIAFDAPGSFVATSRNGYQLASPELDGVIVAHGTWTRSDLLFEVKPGSRRAVDTGLAPLPNDLDLSALKTEDLVATSHDGTKIPLSLLRPASAKRDGSNRVLMEAYGAYGTSLTPFFDTHFLAWSEAGISRAYCHVRGGGEFGEPWHRAGFQSTKANTWKDFNACAERLIELGYTKANLLVGKGTSAGGIMIANAMQERPELYGAVIDNVGAVDILRMAVASQNGPNHYAEFGDPRNKEGFRVLRDNSAYLKVRKGVAYPPTFIMHGVNYQRVEVWQSTKYAARLQAASANPVLLRLDYESGHGFGSTASTRRAEQADWLAFVLWQTGHPAHQP